MRYAWMLLLLAACTPAPAPAPDAAIATPEAVAPTAEAVAAPAADTGGAAPPAVPQAADAAMPATATLRGRVSYPSEELPAMRVCALDRSDPGRGICVRTDVNQPHYELAVPAGTWWLLAWPQDTGAAGDPGLLSDASECLQTGGVGCEDHALRDVEVAAGDVREGLDINDWYYDPQASPPPMAPAE
ncbi:hypothetical protein [Arenimonas sp. MALMAid1274]|uniref:hypothetical protein n=1 Tax=Arenimonas sp. MALMAid1274 TaxID=3411630 RepID=UPI003BA2801B